MEEEVKRSFPVKIIMQDFFMDHRQKAYICVKKHWRTILDLQNHIINLFSLSHEIFLTDSDGFLYPAQETIDVIQQGDVVITVHPQTEESREKLANGKPFKPPRNSTPFLNGLPLAHDIVVTETPIVGIPLPKENGAILPEVREKQKRRKRVRKRKKNNNECQEDSSSVPEEAPEKHKRLKGNKAATHIRFGTSADGDEESFVDNQQITDTPMGQSQVIVSRTLCKTADMSLEVDGVKEKLSKTINKTNMSSSFALEELREKLPDLDVPLLKKLPKKDDVIAFKVLKMGECYEPIVSNYIIGIVEMVTKAKNEVAILLLSGEDELKTPQGRFSLPETPSEQCDDILDDDLFVENFSKLKDVRKLDLAKLGTTI